MLVGVAEVALEQTVELVISVGIQADPAKIPNSHVLGIRAVALLILMIALVKDLLLLFLGLALQGVLHGLHIRLGVGIGAVGRKQVV